MKSNELFEYNTDITLFAICILSAAFMWHVSGWLMVATSLAFPTSAGLLIAHMHAKWLHLVASADGKGPKE